MPACMASRRRGESSRAYRNHQWSVEGLDYFRLDCSSQVLVHFNGGDERTRQYGPFQRFSAVNGLAYGDSRVIAFLDYKKNEWLYYDTGFHWPVMVVTGMETLPRVS